MRAVGLIGAGRMGFEMIEALIAAGYKVVVYDPAPHATERAGSAGATIARSPSEVAGSTETILLSLPTPESVREAVSGSDGLLEEIGARHVIVDTSTVDPGTSEELATLATKRGAGYLDAPVLGRPDACGRWTLPVGGSIDDLERVEDVLAVISHEVQHVGSTGSGNTVKLLNNLMFGAIGAVTAEALGSARRLGIPPERFYEIVAGSEAATVSPLFKSLGERFVSGDFSPIFSVDLMRKDVSLAVSMLESSGGGSPVGRSVLGVADSAIEAGYGGDDVSALAKVYVREGSGAS